MPGTGISIAIIAPLPLVIGRRTLFSTPNRKGVVVYLIGVVKGIASVVEPARFYILAWLSRTKFSLISDDLNTLDLVPTMHKINMLQKEKAAFHPLEGNVSLYIRAGHFPGADQSIQAFETGIRLGWLRRLSVRLWRCSLVLFGHNISPIKFIGGSYSRGPLGFSCFSFPGTLDGRRDVLVEPEEVGWIVATLDRPEPVPGRPGVGHADACLALVAEEVDVHTAITLS